MYTRKWLTCALAFFGALCSARSGSAACTPSDTSNCPTTCPGQSSYDVPGTAWAANGIAGVHAVCGIAYDPAYASCGSQPDRSCTVMDCYYPIGADACTPMLRGDHSGGGNTGNRDEWLSLHGYGPILVAQLTGRVVCTGDYRLAPQYPLPAILQDTRCMMFWLVADRGKTVPGNRRDVFYVGDSWSAIPALDNVLSQGRAVPFPDSCPSPTTAEYSYTGAASAFGVTCLAAGCANTFYHYTPAGNIGQIAANESLDVSDEAQAIVTDQQLQVSPMLWMTQANVDNVRLIRQFQYGIGDALVCHGTGSWNPDAGISCGGTPVGNPMNDLASTQTIAALTSVPVPDIGYAGGHELAMNGDVQSAFYVDLIRAIVPDGGATLVTCDGGATADAAADGAPSEAGNPSSALDGSVEAALTEAGTEPAETSQSACSCVVAGGLPGARRFSPLLLLGALTLLRRNRLTKQRFRSTRRRI